MKLETTKSWIEKCLASEQNPDSQSLLTKNDLENITQETLLDLKVIFEHFVEAFADIKTSSVDPKTKETKLLSSIHIYDLTKNRKGFMIFRKGCRLIFSQESPGCIRIQMLTKKDNLSNITRLDTQIKATINSAISIRWTHQEHKGFIDFNILARYHMRLFLIESQNLLS